MKVGMYVKGINYQPERISEDSSIILKKYIFLFPADRNRSDVGGSRRDEGRSNDEGAATTGNEP
jgi:hypothetical protein